MAEKDNCKTPNPKQLSTEQVKLQEIIGNDALAAGLPQELVDETTTIAAGLFSSGDYVGRAWYEYLMQVNAVVYTGVDQRIKGVQSKEFEIVGSDETADDVAAFDLVNDVVNNKNDNYNMYELVGHAMTALVKGFSVTEFIWDYDDQQRLIPVKANFLNTSHFVFGPNNELRWIDKEGGDNEKGIELDQCKFMVHQHQATYENPYGQSILGVRAIWLHWFKAKLWQSYLEYCNRAGVPPQIYTVPPNIWQNETAKGLILNAASNVLVKKSVILPEGSSASFIEPSGKGAELFLKGVEYCDAQMALNIMGQANTMNSGPGGSYARDDVAYNSISGDLMIANARELEDTLNRQFIRRIVDFNFPGKIINYPEIRFNTEESGDQKELSEVVNTFYNMGLPLSKEQIRKDFNLTPPVDEEDTLQMPTQVATEQGFSRNIKSQVQEFKKKRNF
jgi:phage gp29-like protein